MKILVILILLMVILLFFIEFAGTKLRFFFFRKNIIKKEILHEIEKNHKNILKEATFNVKSNGSVSNFFCYWGDDVQENLEFFNKNSEKYNLPNIEFRRNSFMTESDFILERNEFYSKHNKKETNPENKNYGLYCSNNEVSTNIIKRFLKKEIDVNLDEIKEAIDWLLNYNYIKQIGCCDDLNNPNEKYYYYDVTDKGKSCNQILDESLTQSITKKFLIFGSIFLSICTLLVGIIELYLKYQ